MTNLRIVTDIPGTTDVSFGKSYTYILRYNKSHFIYVYFLFKDFNMRIQNR